MNEKKAAAVGKAGENLISKTLEGIPGAYVLRNLYIPRRGDKPTEIDVLVATTKGLFVIESKAWTGWIRGSTRLNDWSVRIWVGAKPEKRYSPIKQNATHVYALSRFLNLPANAKPHSVIVFTSPKAELKQVPKSTKDFTIIKGAHNLRTFIKRRLSSRHDIFSEEELRSITIKLKQTSDITGRQKRAHILNAKKAEKKRLAEKERRRKARKKTTKRKKKAAIIKFFSPTAFFKTFFTSQSRRPHSGMR